MNSERDPFGLSGLAQPQPPADGWPAVEAVLRRQNTNRRFRWLAAAAVVTIAVGIYWQLPQQQAGDPSPSPGSSLADVSARQATDLAREAEDHLARDAASLASLVKLSQQLERNLRLIRNEVSVMPEQALIYQVELQDLVAQVDEAINQSPQSRELWSQRVNLLLDLNQLYRVQLRRDYSHVASL